jgi:hypothetical protein
MKTMFFKVLVYVLNTLYTINKLLYNEKIFSNSIVGFRKLIHIQL